MILGCVYSRGHGFSARGLKRAKLVSGSVDLDRDKISGSNRDVWVIVQSLRETIVPKLTASNLASVGEQVTVHILG